MRLIAEGGVGGGEGGEEAGGGGGGPRSMAGLHTWRQAAGWIGAIDQPQSVCSARLLGLCGRRLFLNYYRRQMLVRRCSLSRLDDCSAAASHRNSSAHTATVVSFIHLLWSSIVSLSFSPVLFRLCGFPHLLPSFTVSVNDSHIMMQETHCVRPCGKKQQKNGNERKCNLANWFRKHAIGSAWLNLWPVLLYHNKNSRRQSIEAFLENRFVPFSFRLVQFG